MKTQFESRGFTWDELADLATLRKAHELTCSYIAALCSLPNLQSKGSDDLDGTPGYAALEAAGMRMLLENSISDIESRPEAERVEQEAGDWLEYDTSREDDWIFE